MRLLSERIDTDEDGSPSREAINKGSTTNLLSSEWENPITQPAIRQNGYGSVPRTIEIT